jgi:outer membrane protein assembly factor BamD
MLLVVSDAGAFWVWTPESNKWVNPKFTVKDTPEEQLKHALEFYENKEYKEALDEFKKLLQYYPKAKEAPDAQFYIGKIQQDEGNLFEAFNAYQVVIDKYPFSNLVPDIVKRQYEIGNALLEGEGKRNIVLSAVIGGNYNVIEVYRQVIKNAPYGEYAPPSQYKIGLYLQEKKLFQESRDEFEKTINDYPDSEWAKAAQFQIAMSDAKRSAGAGYDQQITKSAIQEFKNFVEIYPDAELSRNAQQEIFGLREKEAENNFVIAQFYEKRKEYKAAKIYYSTIVEDYKDSRWVPKALEKIRQLNTKIN